ncbi:MAG: DUF2309 domain-containing protein [Cytophagales bacterium]
MSSFSNQFNKQEVIAKLKKYLPAQAPLKDFIFQNSLAAYQDKDFFEALREASSRFGYKTMLTVNEFRELYHKGKIKDKTIDYVLSKYEGEQNLTYWRQALKEKEFQEQEPPRIGVLRGTWKKKYALDLDTLVHPILFRILCSYLDQGISIWNFPLWKNGFLNSVLEMDSNSYSSFFKTQRPKKLLREGNCTIESLLEILVGDESLFERYLFDQQFAHQGWAGMISVIESRPEILIDSKKITLEELIILELLLEIDFIDFKYGTQWAPLSKRISEKPSDIFAPIQVTEKSKVRQYWQLAFEWSYYNEVLNALKNKEPNTENKSTKSFQAFFCIDDREISIRDHVERQDPNCETFGTPGFFNVDMYFQPSLGKSYTKLCPAPMSPKYLIKEYGHQIERKKDLHFEKRTFSLSTGWLVSQTLGIWDAIKLAVDIFRPSSPPSMASSFRHMDTEASLTIENTDINDKENGWQIGYTIYEMADRVEALLRSIGLLDNFAPIVYVVGHGASSVNNPFYTTMDCGACSCRPGSVNARVFSFMANHLKVRDLLKQRGIEVPETTQFVGALHDTTTDDILYFDETILSVKNVELHKQYKITFKKALDLNAKERSRRFESIDSTLPANVIHKKIRTRTVSLFQPRPELDHATNALTIVGSRNLTKNIFLDRRAFLNSYDYKTDPDGTILVNIMKPLGPVCGGINLNYYFSRVDIQKLGAGSKLPHNVMGLFGVANGIDGDLRPGLPRQMVEAHDPIRQLFIVEHFPEVVLKTIMSVDAMYQWFINNWIHLIALNPVTQKMYLFQNGSFEEYNPIESKTPIVSDIEEYIVKSNSLENLPVAIIK